MCDYIFLVKYCFFMNLGHTNDLGARPFRLKLKTSESVATFRCCRGPKINILGEQQIF